jgi:hypothetical protein
MGEAEALECGDPAYYQNIEDLLDLSLALSERTSDDTRPFLMFDLNHF